jgi:tetratricopeptide (TPR) repeat protein
MELSLAETNHLQTLIQKIRAGDIALFIGAGASIGSKAPKGDDLVESIKKEFSDMDFEGIGYNLLDVCQEIDDMGRFHALSEYIKRIFYGLKPSATHNILSDYDWSIIFTTNYDNLIESTFEDNYKKSDYAKLCRPFFRGDKPFRKNKKDEIKLLKLMGDIQRDDVEERAVLTRKEYIKRANSRKKMLSNLTDYIHDGSVLYIGYSFRDRIVWELIDELIEEIGIEPDVSYALVPNMNNDPKIERNLNTRRIIPIPITLEGFVEELKKSGPASKIDLNKRPTNIVLKLKYGEVNMPYSDYKEFNEEFRIISENIFTNRGENRSYTEKERIEKFLKGQSNSWEPFEKNWDFKRDLYFELEKRIQLELQKDRPEENNTLLLLGGGGLGKSIILQRLAYETYKQGYPVIILNSYQTNFDRKLIAKFCDDVNNHLDPAKERHKTLIIVDNAEVNIDNLRNIRIFLKNRSIRALILGAARPNEWEHSKTQWGLSGVVRDEDIFIIPQAMREKEISRLVEHLGKLLENDEILNDLDYWIDKAKTDYESDFFAIIYGIVDPARRKLKEILWDEYWKLPSEPAKRAYEYVCLFYQYGIPLKLEFIVNPLKKFGYSYNQFQKEILDEEAKSLIIKIEGDVLNDELYRAKNKLIAKKIAERLFDPSSEDQLKNMVDRYAEVLAEVKPLEETDLWIAKLLLINYLGPKGFASGTLDRSHLSRLYEILIANRIEDAAILHHYGILKSDEGDFESAKELLNKALRISGDRFGWSYNPDEEKNVSNSLGVLYSKEALKYTDIDDDQALKYFDKAVSYFDKCMLKDPSSPYPYHSKAYNEYLKGSFYDKKGKKFEALKCYSNALEIIDDSKESVSTEEMEVILLLESKIYDEKLGDFKSAKEKFLSFISANPSSLIGYKLLSEDSYLPHSLVQY